MRKTKYYKNRNYPNYEIMTISNNDNNMISFYCTELDQYNDTAFTFIYAECLNSTWTYIAGASKDSTPMFDYIVDIYNSLV